MNIDLFHRLVDKNICFKALSINDAALIHYFASDEEVSRFVGWNLMITYKKPRTPVTSVVG